MPCLTFDLQGHRGARGLFPENTLEGFAATVALGVDSIELDIAVTADEVPVVTHDPILNPDIVRRDGAWLSAAGPPIRSLRLADLAQYDVGRLRPGSRYAAAFPNQRPCDGARIPTLGEVFACTGGVRIDAELKTAPELTVPPGVMADIVIAAAEQSGALARLVVRSFDWRGLRHVRSIRPTIPLVWLTDAGHPDPISAVVAEAGEAWAPAFAALSRAAIDAAHGRGLRVLPWTVNEPDDMRRLISWGVDGLCTDRPDLARSAMQAEGLALPRSARPWLAGT